MKNDIEITAVIPTCNRKKSLLRLLNSLNQSNYALNNLIIVDSGEERLEEHEYKNFTKLSVRYITTVDRSVCIQRNIGIWEATSPWIFLCDDDLEVPDDYLSKLVKHSRNHPEAGAIAGLFLQYRNNEWKDQFPLNSPAGLFWRFIFKLTIWGEINCRETIFTKPLIEYYKRKGNHISKSGWPIVTNFSGEYFKTPIYTLGAAMVKRAWLLDSPFDEVLDPHGIGDNYGVALGFPSEGIHLLKSAFVYHHEEKTNRIKRPQQYFKRVLAIDYFMETKEGLRSKKKLWLLWSLIGNVTAFVFSGNILMARVGFKVFLKVLTGNNAYVHGKRFGLRIVKPNL